MPLEEQAAHLDAHEVGMILNLHDHFRLDVLPRAAWHL